MSINDKKPCTILSMVGLLVFLQFFLTVVAFADEVSCVHTPEAFACVQYVKNYDGDTITFNIPNVHPLLGKTIAVRVDGIDTAEVKTKSACEKQAARTARRLVANILGRAKRIDLKNVKRGKYFRVVADVIADGKSIKDTLLAEKLAVVYDGGRKPASDWCAIVKMAP